ncbi:Gfo/Idh/MocA family oxidoreductase [Jeotgalibacillus sp. ET6]|uniref:Gfo/Idh/MocA family protein n=1 Tax=Jeotgalibacillus sp. ET6 TaxID=3037260 RepID=UPI002418A74B|nr:Gfo/Idh/MocA family oxidoreductase [Jeotgalibacillus sp. ET6]MDG5473645.1 Gfo/Idh/MocA family oxidoreductase [Jeotgalibacillus sp. ET6]
MLKAGIIGCGYISKKHLDTLLRIDRVELGAVSDVEQSRMQAACDYYKKHKKTDTTIRQHTNYIDLIQNKEIDIVVIAVISGLHSKIAKEALTAGKHVIIEKPLALSIKDSNEIISLSALKKKRVLVCHQLRFRPILSKIKEIIESGYLGRPCMGSISVRINRSEDYYEAAPWRGSWDQDGGMLINQGIHMVDLLIWLLGDVQSVYGDVASVHSHKETEDLAAGILHFTNQAKGVIEVNSITKPSNQGYSLSLFFEKGSITLGGKGFDQLEHCFIENREALVQELELLCANKDEHFIMYQHFINAVEDRVDVLRMDAAEGKKALEAIFALYQSSKIGLPVQLPLEHFSTASMSVSKRKEDSND